MSGVSSASGDFGFNGGAGKSINLGGLNRTSSSADTGVAAVNLLGHGMQESDVDARSRAASVKRLPTATEDDDIEIDTYGFMDPPPTSTTIMEDDDEYSVLPPVVFIFIWFLTNFVSAQETRGANLRRKL